MCNSVAARERNAADRQAEELRRQKQLAVAAEAEKQVICLICVMNVYMSLGHEVCSLF